MKFASSRRSAKSPNTRARSSGIIFNGGGGDWDGDVISNNGYIRNDAKADNSLEALANWKGDIYGNSNTIENGGTWTGDIISAGTLNANTGNTGVIFPSALPPGDVAALWPTLHPIED